MHILLLSSSKLISKISQEQWENLTKNHNISLYIDNKSEEILDNIYKNLFFQFKKFSNLPNNDLVEMSAIELHQIKKIDKIIPLIESEILRAARLRNFLNIDGELENEVIFFRDKFAMKSHAIQKNITVAKFTKISHTIELLEFVQEVGFPVIIKPIAGRGSADTFLIKDKHDLLLHLDSGIISNTNRNTELLAEEYIEGEVYHSDGIILNHEIKLLSSAKYVNNCLSFVNGEFLGSVILQEGNALKNKVEKFVHNLIYNVYKFPKNCLFHIELFVTKNEDLILCEVACRLGGNGIKDEINVSYGRDILIDYLSYELNNLNLETYSVVKQNKISGRLLIPPENATLLKSPNECPYDWVVKYINSGIIGKKYEKMKMSNSEIASFLIAGESEIDVQNKINILAKWFTQYTTWSY